MPPDPAPVPRDRAAVVVDDAEDVVLRCFRPLLAAVLGAPEVGDRLPLPTLVELGAAGCECVIEIYVRGFIPH